MSSNSMTIIDELPKALETLSKGITFTSGDSKKFKIEIGEGEYDYDKDYPVLVVFARITNLSDEICQIDSIAFRINDSIKVEHKEIKHIQMAFGNQFGIDFNHDGVVVEGNFTSHEPMKFSPKIAENEQAYGLVLFDFRKHKNIPIKSLKIFISIAGHSDEFFQELKQ